MPKWSIYLYCMTKSIQKEANRRVYHISVETFFLIKCGGLSFSEFLEKSWVTIVHFECNTEKYLMLLKLGIKKKNISAA